MSIKYRVVIFLTILAALYVLVTSQVMSRSVLSIFTSLEQEYSRRDAGRVSQYIDSEMARLDEFALDWGFWSQTHKFMLGLNPDFVADNLSWGEPLTMRANVLALIDTDNRLRWGEVYDLEAENPRPIEDYYQLGIADSPRVSGLTSVDDLTHGFLNDPGPGPPLLFVSCPILNNNGVGPVAGTIVIGRFLDDYFIREMRDKLSLEINIWDVQEALPPELEQLQADLIENPAGQFWLESDTELRHFYLSTDIHFEPAFIVEIVFPRRILSAAEEAVATAITYLVVALLLFMLVIWLIFDKVILAPMGHLHALPI